MYFIVFKQQYVQNLWINKDVTEQQQQICIVNKTVMILNKVLPF